MRYGQTAPKRPVNMTLNEDVVRQARGLTSNLSDTVEILLAHFIEGSDAKAAEQSRHIAAHIVASEAFVREHGALADAFNEL